MGRLLRILVPLLAGLTLLTGVASWLVTRTTWAWSEADVAMRADLAVKTAHDSFVRRWGTPAVRALLVDIARDERVMGAAVCDLGGDPMVATPDFPRQIGCDTLLARVRPHSEAPLSQWAPWASMLVLPGGEVQVAALPLADADRPLGVVALAHDMTFAVRRQTELQRFIIIGFAILAVAASVLTILAFRISWQGWNRALVQLMGGGSGPPEFRPLLRDIRALTERLVAERAGGAPEWTARRLKQTLQRHLHGEKVIVLANREPYIHDRAPDGTPKVVHPASGMVTALEPVMRACSGVWVAHGSGSADRETADEKGRLHVPPGEDAYVLRRVWLTPEQERGYYYGFSNEGLWPLCHIAHTRPVFRSEDWTQYQAVNRIFADAVCDEADVADPIVLVQDYHFALAPTFIRERLPRATILTFWHIPWPNAESFGICPWREELMTGLLGSSILAFHTQQHCNNFLDGADAFLEARIDREMHAVVQHGRSTLVRPHPISVEWPSRWMQGIPSVAECRASVVAELGLRPDALIGVGIDRLDYTKGIEERLLAVERLLEREPELRGRFTFVQLAAPSRTAIPEYQRLNDSVERVTTRINARFAAGTYRPIVLHRAHHEPPTVFRYYRAADVLYVSSLHDGMNLVAKEFVESRDDELGVLVLSQFTGAARELSEALVVNPYDLDQAASALGTAVRMPTSEQRDRMRSMRSLIQHFNVYRWAGRMLVDAAQVRERERLAGRLMGGPFDAGAST